MCQHRRINGLLFRKYLDICWTLWMYQRRLKDVFHLLCVHKFLILLWKQICQMNEKSYLRNIIPMRDMVAGEAELKSCVSNKKFTLGPNCMRSPDGIVSKRLSSKTEFRDSIHSGSMSPSQMIHEWTSNGSRTTRRAAFVRTPSDHSRVSISMCPKSWKERENWRKIVLRKGPQISFYKIEGKHDFFCPLKNIQFSFEIHYICVLLVWGKKLEK